MIFQSAASQPINSTFFASALMKVLQDCLQNRSLRKDLRGSTSLLQVYAKKAAASHGGDEPRRWQTYRRWALNLQNKLPARLHLRSPVPSFVNLRALCGSFSRSKPPFPKAYGFDEFP